MQDDLNLRDYIRIVRKRKWIVLALPLLSGLVGALFTATPTTLYEAVAKIQISKSGLSSQVLLDTYYYYETGNYLDTQAQILTSQEIIKEASKRLNLIPTTATDQDIIDDDAHLLVLAELTEAVRAEPIFQTSILQITARSPRPDGAIRIVNTVIDVYIERHTYALNRQVIDSRRYVEEQLGHYERSLRVAEDALSEFDRSHASTLSLAFGELAQTQKDLERVESDLQALDLQLDLIDNNLEPSSDSNLDFLAGLSLQEPRIQNHLDGLLSLRKERQQLLTYQTPRSPEVLALDEQIRAALPMLRAELVGARERLLPEQARLEGKLRALPANDARRARLAREVQANERMYLLLKEEDQRARLREAGLVQEVTVVERPVTATLLPQTGRLIKGLVGLFIGLFVGFVIALIIEGLDTSIGAIEEVETLLNIPVVGVVPPIDFEKTSEVLARANPALATDSRAVKLTSALVTHCDPKSPTAEAYRAIRTAIDNNGTEAAQVILVTSSVGGEGKTTTAANLAVTFAQMGRRTLLIGADLRKPDMHKLFGLDNEFGLANVLVENLPLEKAIHGVSEFILGDLGLEVVSLTPGLDNLYVMPSGTGSLNPAEILSSKATAETFQEIRGICDVAIIDTPPVMSVTDAAILCGVADGVVLVYELGKVARDVLKRANAHLQLAQAKMLGVVLNDVKADAATTLADSYHYYNYYYYGRESTDLVVGPWRRFARAAAGLFRRRGSV